MPALALGQGSRVAHKNPCRLDICLAGRQRRARAPAAGGPQKKHCSMGSPSCPAADAVSCSPGRAEHMVMSEPATAIALVAPYTWCGHRSAQPAGPHKDAPLWSAPALTGPADYPHCPCTCTI